MDWPRGGHPFDDIAGFQRLPSATGLPMGMNGGR